MSSITPAQIGIVITDVLTIVAPHIDNNLRAGIVAGLTGLYVLGSAIVKYAVHKDTPGGNNNVSKHP